jgi:hypothetical protein
MSAHPTDSKKDPKEERVCEIIPGYDFYLNGFK